MKVLLVMIAILSLSTPSAAQNVTLAELESAARSADPRMRQLDIEAEQSELRLRALAAERRPVLSVEAQAQYQSDVIEFPFRLPGGAAPPSPPNDTYDASVRLEQSVVDPTLRARAAAERARLAETRARINTTLYGLRQEIGEAFFGAAALQEREAQIMTAIADLEARLRETRVSVAEGVALPSDAASLEVTLLARRQDAVLLRGQRRAALVRLAELSGRQIDIEQALVLPDVAGAVTKVRARLEKLRQRPEYEQFDRARERLEVQKSLVDAAERPRVAAFARAGYGKPGLNFLSNDFDAYWVAGVRLQWKPWTWGASERERRQLELQQESIKADEEAFSRTLRRTVQTDLASVDDLHAVLALDEKIVALREAIARETRIRYDERVVTAAELVAVETDVLEARLVRSAHRVELARAGSRLLTVLGVETPR